jgi:hypothetical protein
VSPNAAAIVAWLQAGGREVVCLDAPGEPPPLVAFRPIAPIRLVVQRGQRQPWLLHVLMRAVATWAQHERIWAFSLAGGEVDAFLTQARRQMCPARLGLLALGGADRVVPRAPAAPAGLFVAPASAVERAAVRTFGSDDDRRLLLRVDTPPWRRLALLDTLNAA